MKELNYKRAWEQYVRPVFLKLCPSVMEALDHTRRNVDKLSQVGASNQLSGVPVILRSMFDCIPKTTLAWASEVVYYYGHLAPDGSAQDDGLYWKFQKLAITSLVERGAGEQILAVAKQQMKAALKNFDDHKEGTEYSDDEVVEFVRSELPNNEGGFIEMLRVDRVNNKPDTFCIGRRHFKSDSVYLDPSAAPCAGCGRPYSEHTSDRVMFVKVLNEDTNSLQVVLKAIVDFCKEHTIMLDGFTLVKGTA